MSDPRAELRSSLRGLSIGEKGPVQDIPRPTTTAAGRTNTTSSTAKPKKPTQQPVADSWEDEANLSSEDDKPTTPLQDTTSPSSMLSPALSLTTEGPLDPPPTPISPQTSHPWGPASASASAAPATSPGGSARRPEKQTAVAGRLIAGALGIRAPKRTEEQRAYDRAMKEQEIKRRNREREDQAKVKEEEEKLKNSVWTD